ncbi:TetR/AcrR family transcriptional regulator [Thalassotalea psychrophila]|uniref:TetR/AcrR family transcriptional regulator n=1 Tax=Thalassotalea psychrophila TaxID=3065647 RepID=A0ABY9TUK4_9GAMM|nr:TetR/AcrR family transcriptional regulator [Colwelliaceae bacterium SQ149]
MKDNPEKLKYHHGDLRSTLLVTASEMLKENGIEEITLRKIAARVGVSRAAPYHHFKDKNSLLCGIAEVGYKQLYKITKTNFNNTDTSMKEKFSLYVHQYVSFAKNNPELYELMFGRTIWMQKNSTQELKDVAYPCFQFQLEMINEWQKIKLLNSSNNDKHDALRMSQVLWGTIHGIAKLLIDGIYTDISHIEEICDKAVDIFLADSN